MTRFVLLRHECPTEYRDGPHWDLMVERPDALPHEHRLATWSLLALPSPLGDGTPGTVAAVALPDHRARYLEYEGPISGGRGHVRRITSGHAEWLEQSSDTAIFRLAGPPPFSGIATLRRLGGADWLLAWQSLVDNKSNSDD